MPEPVSAYQFLQHVAARWRVPVIACVTAAVLAFAGSKLMTKEYVAAARILIEPPGTSDPRSALVVSPVYMDSLRTYTLFASSDELFKEAVETLGIRDPEDPKPLSRLKETILEVEIPRNTKVLEIRVTLTDPEKAQILAGYLAEATVRLNQELNAASDEARTAAPRRARDHAARRVRDAEKQLRLFAQKEPVAGLDQELEALVSTRTILRLDLLRSDRQQSERVGTHSSSGGGETEGTRDQGDAPGTGKLKSRTAHLREQVSQLDEEIKHILGLAGPARGPSTGLGGGTLGGLVDSGGRGSALTAGKVHAVGPRGAPADHGSRRRPGAPQLSARGPQRDCVHRIGSCALSAVSNVAVQLLAAERGLAPSGNSGRSA